MYTNFFKPCTFSCLCFCRPEIFLTLKYGNKLIGSVKHIWTLCSPEFEVYNSKKSYYLYALLLVVNAVFYVKEIYVENLQKLYLILQLQKLKTLQVVSQKKGVSSFEELISKADSFELIFPSGISGYDKLLLTSLALMIDYQYFEIKNESKNKSSGLLSCLV